MKYYRLNKNEIVNTSQEIPQDKWEIKQVLPYEEKVIYEEVNKSREKTENLEILSDKVIKTITKYRVKKTLDELKQQKINEVKSLASKRYYEGFICSNGIKLDCRKEDKINWLYLKLDCQANPNKLQTIRDFNNKIHTDMNSEDILSMISELENNYIFILQTKWNKEEEIKNIINKSSLELINIEGI